MLKKWENLPEELQKEDVIKYYEILANKKTHLFFKRLMDITGSLILLIFLSPILLIMGI